MPATEDMGKMAGEVAMAVEAVVEAPWLLWLARQFSQGHVKYLHHWLWKQGQGRRHASNLKGEDCNLHWKQVW
jgi:hypothetical protein